VVIDAGPKNTTNEDALPSEGRSLLTKPLTEPTLLEMSGYRVYRDLSHISLTIHAWRIDSRTGSQILHQDSLYSNGEKT
jgi:hypothetical protein